MKHWQRLLQIEQPEGAEAIRPRVWLIIAVSFVFGVVILLPAVWGYSSRNAAAVPPIFAFSLTIVVFIVGLLLIWRWWIWQIALLETNGVRAAASLQSEARYRLLFEASPVALWEQDGSAVMAHIDRLREEGVQDFRTYFEQNPAVVVELMGYTKALDVNETVVTLYKAKNKSELMDNLDRLLPEDSYPFVINSLEAMSNRVPFFEQEISSLTLDGEKLTVLYRWAIPPDQKDAYTTVIASIVDVTARKQAEDALQNYSERLRGLHELDLAINVKYSPEEIAGVALRVVAQFVPSWGAAVWAYDEEGQMASLLALSLADEEGERPFPETTQPIAALLSEEMQDDMRINQPYVVDDLRALRYLPPSLMELKKHGVRSFMQIPLLVRDNLIGFLSIYDKSVHTFRPKYIGIAQEFAAPLAIALGNVQLFVAENRARNQAETLRQVAAELNTSLELEPLLGHILEYLAEVVPYDSAAIFLERESSLKIVTQRGLPQNIHHEIAKLKDTQLRVHDVYTSGRPQIIADTRKYPDWTPIPGSDYIRCWMGVPLQVKGKTIGALALDKAVARFYGEKNQELAMAFANQAAVAIDNARLYEQTRQYAADLEARVDERTRDLTTLYEVTAVASTHLELDKILDESLALLLDALACFAGAIHVLEEDGTFHLKGRVGVGDHLLPVVSIFESTNEFVRHIIEESAPLFVRDLAALPLLKSLQLPAATFSYAGVCMCVKDDVVGILSVVHEGGKQFSPDDIALLASVADHFGVVIENGRLRQKTQEMAVLQERERLARELHDSVTQLLYSLTLFAEASQDLSRSGDGHKLREVLDDIGTTAQQALKEMRLMLYELRSGALMEEGLVNALRYRLEAVEGRSGIDANMEAQIDADIPPDLERVLYLVAQEALNNTLKHAKATAVFVTLSNQENKLIMTIDDNGRGFSSALSVAGGMGLQTMRDRIEGVGGHLRISSLPGVGTKIELSIDLEKYGVA